MEARASITTPRSIEVVLLIEVIAYTSQVRLCVVLLSIALEIRLCQEVVHHDKTINGHVGVHTIKIVGTVVSVLVTNHSVNVVLAEFAAPVDQLLHGVVLILVVIL